MMRAAYRKVGGALAFHEDHGEPGARPVLCIHTAGQGGVQWREVAGPLAALGYRVIVPDLPGHGRSEPAPSGPVRDLGAYAAWCAELIELLELERPFVAGCSIGGKIALDLACRMGTVLSGVVTMAAEAGLLPAQGKAMKRGLERELEDSAAPSRTDRTHLGTLAVVGRTVPPARRELIATMHRREDPAVSTSDLIGWAGHDLWDRLPGIACPTHLVVGEDDLWVDADAVRRTAALAPGGCFTLLDGIGHYPMEEVPGFAAVLDGWFRDMERRP